MMVGAPAFGDAVERVRSEAPTLGVGLHLDLVAGKPLTVAPSLTDSTTGRFHALDALARRALAGQVDAAEVRRECEAQLRALTAVGIEPTHIDSHRHAHALP